MTTIALSNPGNSFATWLAGHHPDLFLAAFKQAKAAKVAKQVQLHGLRGLGQDGTTTFDASSDVTASFDPNATAATVINDTTPSGSSFIASLADTQTSSGSSLGSALASFGSGVSSALQTVGGWVGNNVGTLANLAKSYYSAQAATATAQTQQAVLQTQLARAAVGQTAAPITYTTNAAGQLVPVYTTQTAQGAVYQPLTNQGVKSLAPSSVSVFLSQYGLYLGIGALVVVGVAMARR